MSAHVDFASDEIRERIVDLLIPGGERSWMDLAVDAARAGGVSVDDVLGRRRHAPTVRARRSFWASLRAHGYSYPVIARALGVDHSTVHTALAALKARGDRRDDPRAGYAGMGLGGGI